MQMDVVLEAEDSALRGCNAELVTGVLVRRHKNKRTGSELKCDERRQKAARFQLLTVSTNKLDEDTGWEEEAHKVLSSWW